MRSALSLVCSLALTASAAQAAPRGVHWIAGPDLPVSRAAAAPANAHLEYYGGPILSNVHVYAVLWGPNVPSETATGIGDFYAAVTDSGLFDMLGEYSTDIVAYGGGQGTGQKLGRGTFGGTLTITPSITATNITDADIQKELQLQISKGALPPSDANTIYMFHFPKGMSISMPDGSGTARSCKQFCAYHSTIAHQPSNLYYGVIPDVNADGCETGCGAIGGGFGNTTEVASHELVEAVTDADVGLATDNAPPLAWYDPQGQNAEIGDICNGDSVTIHAHNKAWVVQTEWSNTHGACIGETTANDFFLNLSPGNLAVAAGSTGTFTITSGRTAGTVAAIALAADGLPTGVTATFSAPSLAPGALVTMTVKVDATAANGLDLFTIHGSAGGVSRKASAHVTVSGGVAPSGGGGGGGGGGSCAPGEVDIFGICIPLGCSSLDGTSLVTLLGLGAGLLRRRRKS